MPDRSDYPRCKTCGHWKDDSKPGGKRICDAPRSPVRYRTVTPFYGCIHHTDFDAPGDPRRVTGTCEHGYLITEADDE